LDFEILNVQIKSNVSLKLTLVQIFGDFPHLLFSFTVGWRKGGINVIPLEEQEVTLTETAVQPRIGYTTHMISRERGVMVLFPLMIVALCALIGSGAYWYVSVRPSSGESESALRAKELKAKLVEARAAVKNGTETLEDLTVLYYATRPFQALMQEQYERMESIAEVRTAIFFDESGVSPIGSVAGTKKKNVEETLKAERRKVIEALERWNEAFRLDLGETLGADDLRQAKKDAETIASYIKALEVFVDTLTPEASGFTPLQIDLYKEEVEAAKEEIQSVLASLASAPPAPSPNSAGEAANANPVTTSGNPSAPKVSVTAEEVLRESEALAEAREEVARLESEIAELETSGTQGGESPSEPQEMAPPPTILDTSPSASEGNASGGEGNAGEGQDFLLPPILVEPGPPKLIQGSNRD